MTNHEVSNSQFESLVRECRQELVRFLGRLVGGADAEDVVQIALAKAAAALSGFRGEASPRSWLFRIATNAAHDWNRARPAWRSEPLPEEDEETAEDLSEDATQERRLVREQMSQCVGEVVRRLPESYQAALALSDCEELSDRELAAVLGVTVGAAKIRLHRARTRLKEELERECSFYRDPENVICCDRKPESRESTYRSEERKTSADAYRFEEISRHQVDGRTTSGTSENLNQEPTMAVETLPSKQQDLIGIGAAIAAGCQPCTSSFVAAARDAGACERGVRLAIEVGLQGRDSATTAISGFANETFAKPAVDAVFRAERAQLEALMGVAAALASNAAPLVKARVHAARELGATDAQIRLAGRVGLTARRGAERETESALVEALGDAALGNCCAEGSAETGPEPAPCDSAPKGTRAAGACGCSETAEPETETVRIEKTKTDCSLCEEYARKHADKPIVVMSCEGACLRGEISRQAANHLCHELAPNQTVRLCLGGAFTKNGGHRALVQNAKHVVALEGCAIRCASRMMRGHFPDLAAEVILTDALCEFDRSLFGSDALPPGEIQSLAHTVATKVAAGVCHLALGA